MTHCAARRLLLLPVLLALALLVAPGAASAMPLSADKTVAFKVVLLGGEPSDIQLVKDKLEEPAGFFAILGRGGTHWLSFRDKSGGPVQYEQVRPGTDACADFQNGVTTVDPIIEHAPGVDRTGYDVILSIAIGDTCHFQAEGGAGQAGVTVDRNFQQFDAATVHEVGHALDFPHANAWACPATPGTAPWNPTCTPTEYGDFFDVMGLGQGSSTDLITELTVFASDPEYMPATRATELRSSGQVTLTRSQASGHSLALIPTLVADTGSPNLARGSFNRRADPNTVYRNVFAQGVGFEPASYDDSNGTQYGITIRAIPFPVDLPTQSGGEGTHLPTFLFENQHPGGSDLRGRQLFVPGDTFTVPAFNFAPFVPPIWGNEEPVGGPDMSGESTMTIHVVSADADGAVVDVTMDPVPARSEQTVTQGPAAAPTAVTVGGTAGVATASWTAPAGSGITGYDVDWTVDGLTQATRRVTGTAVSLGAVVPGAAVTVRVRAFNGGGLGAAGTAAGTVAGDGSDSVAPQAPGAGSTDIHSDSLMVHWTAPADADVAGYRVRLDGAVVRSVSAGTLEAPITKLRGGTAYVVTVTAIDAAGNVSPALTINATTSGHYTAPVRNIQLTIVGNTVVATWDRGLLGDEPTSYILRWSSMLGTTGRSWPAQTVTTTTGTFDPQQTFAIGDVIFVQIDAVGPGGKGYGHAASIQVPDPNPPETPAVYEPNPSATSVSLSWPNVIYHGVPTNTEVSGIGATQVIGTNHIGFSDLTPSTTYTVTLVAIALQTGARSLPATVTFTTDAGPPNGGATGTPGPASPMDGGTYVSAMPMFFWSTAVNATSYTVNLDGSDVATVTGEYWQPTTPLAQGAHTWLVRATGALGDASSSTRTFTIDSQVDGAPTITSPTAGAVLTNGSPTITWSAATDTGSGLDHYGLLIDGQLVRNTNPATRSTSPWSPIADGAHAFTIVAHDVAGNTLESAPVSVTIQTPSIDPTPSLDADGDALIDAMDCAPYDPNLPAQGAGVTDADCDGVADVVENTTPPPPPPVVVDRTAPTVPARVRVVSASKGAFKLTWGAASDKVGVTAYEVRYRLGTAKWVTKRSTAGARSFAVTRLRSRGTYTVQVRALDKAANASAWVSLKIRLR